MSNFIPNINESNCLPQPEALHVTVTSKETNDIDTESLERSWKHK